MIQPVPATYDAVHHQLRSQGSARLVWPLKALWAEFVVWFARRTLRSVYAGHEIDDPGPLLQQNALGEDTLSLDEWLAAEEPTEVSWDDRQAGLRKLAAIAEDYASDAGAWRELLSNLDELAAEAVSKILQRSGQLIETVRREQGETAARRSLDEILRQLDARCAEHRKKADHWPVKASERLLKIAHALRHYSKPRGRLARIVLRYWSDLPMAWLLGQRRRKEIDRFVEEVNKAARLRYRMAVNRTRQTVYRRLLGDTQRPARLQELLTPLTESRRHAESVLGILRHAAGTDKPSTRSCVVHLVDDLATVLDPRSGRTVRDLFATRSRRAQRSPQGLAAHLREHGLPLGQRPVLPHEWHQHDPATVAAALLTAVHQYLGSANPNGPLDLDNPHSVLKHVASLHLLSPELRTRLDEVLPTVVNRSRPYAEFETLTGDDRQILTFLYCHREQRRQWGQLLRTAVPDIQPPSAANCDIDNPWMMEIHQNLIAAPAGASKQLWCWTSAGNRARRAKIVQPRFDHSAVPERRQLGERVRDHADCQQLFEAGVAASLLYEVGTGTGRYALAHPDPRLEELFGPSVYAARWQSLEFFHGLLKTETRFIDFTCRVFPNLADFRQTAHRLAREDDIDAVADELERLGVIRRRSCQCQVCHVIPRMAADVVEGLYDHKPGTTVGQGTETFLGELFRNDLLYTVLFCGVLDAFEQGWLTENSVPASIVEKSRELQ